MKMEKELDYLEVNKKAWNTKTDIHLDSEFYDVDGFLEGDTSLKSIELELLGDIKAKSILHLQCHFGQDSISLARMGAKVTGVDLSDRAVEEAEILNEKTGTDCRFIQSDVYDLPDLLNEKFDIVFTTYGTIGWLPDMDKWAGVISHFLKPEGKLVFAEFHPVVWMFDDQFTKVGYNYFNKGAIVEEIAGSYTDRDAPIVNDYVMWNHGLAEVMSALIRNSLRIDSFNEYDYSPYDCFFGTEEFEPGKFRIQHIGNQIPMVYSIAATKHSA